MTLPAKKSELRAIFRSLLASIEPETAETWSIAVCNHLQRWWTEHQGHDTPPTTNMEGREEGRGGVMVYAPMVGAGEVDVSGFVVPLLAAKSSGGMGGRGEGGEGGVVAVPRVDWVGGVMSAVAIRDWSRDLVVDQVRRRLGLLVPRSDLPAVRADRLRLIVVPGLAFDRFGGRLGRGAGFYDRFLSELPPPPVGPTVLGVAFDVQMVDSPEGLPTEAHDVRMHGVVTESGLKTSHLHRSPA